MTLILLFVIGGIEVEVHRLIESESLELCKGDPSEPITLHDITSLDDGSLLIEGIELPRCSRPLLFEFRDGVLFLPKSLSDLSMAQSPVILPLADGRDGEDFPILRLGLQQSPRKIILMPSCHDE